MMANDNYLRPIEEGSQIVLYQPDESIRLEVKLDAQHETVWLTQQQIADLFGTKRPAITKHLGNIYSKSILASALDKAKNQEIIETADLEQIQNFIFIHRKTSFLIPSWVYNLLRKKAEAEMNYSAKQIVQGILLGQR